MKILSSSRFAVALVSFCLALGPSVVLAAIPVATGDPGGGWMGGGHGNANTTTTSGNATGGNVSANGDGTASATMNYTTPNDGSTYSGQYTVTSYDANGYQVAQASSTVTDSGNGGTMLVGYDAITVPTGGSVLIRLYESDGSGNTFSAGFRLTNFKP
ncbi:MAG: hypothetical protein M3N49_09705 [Candidatus Eremiobacteraeota bacterium]|nr:hypothetical protein [Candidatus Eremiobacteraeota bacterium]